MKPLIVLTGPTAAGKTDLSIKLAKKINGAIISADSIQVYKYMDIGSAKIMPDEMQGVPHYLVDCLDPAESFDVATFQKMAKQSLDKIYENRQIPIIVGGTGFYIQAVIKDIEFETEEKDMSDRRELEQFYKKNGKEALHKLLEEADPKAAQEIHENNVKRVIRAIEFYRKNSIRISDHNQKQKEKPSPYNLAYFVITDERDVLYERINRRVDIMIEKGLIGEVKNLLDMGYDKNLVSMQGLGYKEIIPYLENKCSLSEAAEIIKRDTRHFAKRQLTWFRREKDAVFFNKADYDRDDDKMLHEMIKILCEKKILNQDG